MLLVHEKRLQIADNTKAFSLSPDIDSELLTPPCGPFEPDQELYWRTITREDIENAVGKYLSTEQIDALRERGRWIMKSCAGTPAPDELAN